MPGESQQTLLSPFAAFRANPVVGPLSFGAAGHDPRVAQNTHMVGEGGLADVQLLQQGAGTFFSGAEKLQNLQPVFIAKGLENPGI